MKKLVLLVLLLSVIAGILFWVYTNGVRTAQNEQPKEANLSIWVLGEDEKVIRGLVDGFSEVSPGTKITTASQTVINYQSRLEAQIQSGKGPDIFKFPVTELPVFIDILTPAPEEAFTAADFKSIFYPVHQENLIVSDKIYAVPESVDGLALFVNVDILRAAGVETPKTWEQFVNGSTKMTVKDSSGVIQTSGAALGTTNNIDFWPEIIELLFSQQPKASLSFPDSQDSADVIQFYTGFVTDPRKKTWDQTLPSDSEMFEQGSLAFYFGTSKKIADFKLHNPDLNFLVVPVPQLSANRNISVGSYWVWGVSDKSVNKLEAWRFLRYMSTTAALDFSGSLRKQNNLPQKPYPRVDMAAQAKALEPNFSTFVETAPDIKSWYLNSDAPEGGINQKMIQIYGKVISDTLLGVNPRTSLTTATPQIKQVLTEYNLD